MTINRLTSGMIDTAEGDRLRQTRGEVSLSNAQVKHLVMLTVAFAWLIYVLVGIYREQLPEVWTWGIPSGVYVALYQPWSKNTGGARGQDIGGPGAPRIGGGDDLG